MSLCLSNQALHGALPICCKYLQLGLSRRALRNIARFRLRAHTLRVEIGRWQIHNRQCENFDLHDVQDEKHVLFYALAYKCAISEGDSQNNLLNLLVGLTLDTQALFTLTV